jgi:hypothetical protein
MEEKFFIDPSDLRFKATYYFVAVLNGLMGLVFGLYCVYLFLFWGANMLIQIIGLVFMLAVLIGFTAFRMIMEKYENEYHASKKNDTKALVTADFVKHMDEITPRPPPKQEKIYIEPTQESSEGKPEQQNGIVEENESGKQDLPAEGSKTEQPNPLVEEKQ